MGGLSLTRQVKQQLEVCLLTSVRSSVVANWTSLSVLRNNVKRNSWGTETICTKILYSNRKKADPGLIYVHRNEDCPWRLYVLLCTLPIHVTCIIYDSSKLIICDWACKNRPCKCKLYWVIFLPISSTQNAVSHFRKLQMEAH